MEIDENKTVCSFLLDEFQAEDREEFAIRLKENVDIDTICEVMLKYGVYVMKSFHKQIKNGNLPIFSVRQRYLKNCIGCGKFVKKKQWVKADDCKDGGGALCFECIGNIEQTSRD